MLECWDAGIEGMDDWMIRIDGRKTSWMERMFE
jgi:hypothetical protein